MLPRAGYTLGLLFVLACAAAYPLTCSRLYILDRRSPNGMLLITVSSGGFTLGTLPDALTDSAVIERTEWRFGSELAPFRPEVLYRVNYTSGSGARWLSLPLWLPALPVSLFMAWRWRRSKRREAAGFPLDQRTVEPPKTPNRTVPRFSNNSKSPPARPS